MQLASALTRAPLLRPAPAPRGQAAAASRRRWAGARAQSSQQQAAEGERERGGACCGPQTPQTRGAEDALRWTRGAADGAGGRATGGWVADGSLPPPPSALPSALPRRGGPLRQQHQLVLQHRLAGAQARQPADAGREGGAVPRGAVGESACVCVWGGGGLPAGAAALGRAPRDAPAAVWGWHVGPPPPPARVAPPPLSTPPPRSPTTLRASPPSPTMSLTFSRTSSCGRAARWRC